MQKAETAENEEKRGGTMKIKKVTFTRKFNLGNYESYDVSAEAELAENENFLDVWTILRDNAEMWHLDQQRKTEKQPPQPQLKPQPREVERATAKGILNEFPPELANLLDVSEVGQVWILKPITFLGTEKWKQINDIVKACDGRWIGAGKESNWEVPKLKKKEGK